jgi:hypothetical protein
MTGGLSRIYKGFYNPSVKKAVFQNRFFASSLYTREPLGAAIKQSDKSEFWGAVKSKRIGAADPFVT